MRSKGIMKVTELSRLVAAVVSCMVLTGCSNSEEAKKEHFENANRFVAADKPQEAVVEYRNALKEDPKFGEARFKLAQAYESLGNANQAFREYVRAADLMPQNTDAQVKAAAYMLAAGQFEDAKTRIQPVIDRDPTNSTAQLILGNALVGLKDLDGAVREIEEAIRLEPGRGLTYSNLAMVKFAQGQKDEAKKAFEKAVEVDPKSVQARLALAYFQWSVNDVAAAEDSLKSALAIEPKNVLANRTLVAFYIGSNRAAQAEPYLKALAAAGAPQPTLQLADYYVSQRRPAEASAILEPLTKDPLSAGAAETRLAALAYATDKSRGHGMLDAVIKREPANVLALLQKTQWLLVETRTQEALVPARAAVKAAPTNITAHYYLGLALDALRQRKEAMAEFGEVLRLNPRATPAQLALSRLNLLEGSTESAVNYAEGALSSQPNNPDARASLVRGLLGRRDLDRAAEVLAPLLKQYPQVATVHVLNGGLKLQKRDFAGAGSAYERALSLSPASVEALAGLTTVELLQNKGPQARQRIEARLATEPNRADLLIIAGQVYANQRDFGKAEAVLRHAIQSDATSSRAYSMLANVLLVAGKLEAALVEFDQMSSRDAKNLSAATMAAMIVHSQNKTADAKKRYEAIVSADPTAAVAANNLAWIYQEEGGKLDEALRLAQAAATRLPESPEVQDTIGMIYVKKELPALAVSAFERSIDKAPDNPSYHYHLALALSKSGNSQRARQSAEQAIKLKPDYPEALKLLAQVKG